MTQNKHKRAPLPKAKPPAGKVPAFTFDAPPRLWFYLACALLVASALRGIRFPNHWVLSNYLFNYDFGFMARAFVGTVTTALGGGFLRTYEFVALFTFLVLCANLFLLSEHIRRLINSRHPLFIGCALIFAPCVAIAYMSYVIGYHDHLGLLATLLCLRVRGFGRKIIAAACAGTVMMLAHEAFLFLFFPLVFVDLYLNADKRSGWHLPAVAAFSLWLLALGWMISQAPVPGAAKMHEAIAAYTPDAGFLLKHYDGAFHHAFLWGTEGELAYRARIWQQQGWGELFASLLMVLPLCIIFLHTANALLRKTALPPALRCLFLTAPLSPMLLHIIGADMHRWNSLIAVNSFLLLSVCFLRCREHSLTAPKAWAAVVVAGIFFSAVGEMPLWNGDEMKSFPYQQHGAYIAGWLAGDHPFIPSVPPGTGEHALFTNGDG